MADDTPKRPPYTYSDGTPMYPPQAPAMADDPITTARDEAFEAAYHYDREEFDEVMDRLIAAVRAEREPETTPARQLATDLRLLHNRTFQGGGGTPIPQFFEELIRAFERYADTLDKQR